jgi:hypothetical protein
MTLDQALLIATALCTIAYPAVAFGVARWKTGQTLRLSKDFIIFNGLNGATLPGFVFIMIAPFDLALLRAIERNSIYMFLAGFVGVVTVISQLRVPTEPSHTESPDEAAPPKGVRS